MSDEPREIGTFENGCVIQSVQLLLADLLLENSCVVQSVQLLLADLLLD